MTDERNLPASDPNDIGHNDSPNPAFDSVLRGYPVSPWAAEGWSRHGCYPDHGRWHDGLQQR